MPNHSFNVFITISPFNMIFSKTISLVACCMCMSVQPLYSSLVSCVIVQLVGDHASLSRGRLFESPLLPPLGGESLFEKRKVL